MGFLAALGGIAAGTLVAFLLGVILDYLQVRNVLPESVAAWMFLPYTSAAAGFISSLLAVSLFGKYLKNRGGAAEKAGAARSTSTTRTATPKGMEHVPGMPTFDVEAIRKANSGGIGTSSSTATRTPEQKQ